MSKESRHRKPPGPAQERQSRPQSTFETIYTSGELLRAIVDNAVDAILTIDERGIVQSANPAVERMFGYSVAEIIGRNVNLLAPSPYREEHDDYLRNFLETGERKIIGIGREVVGRRKDGTTFPIHLAVSEIPLGDRRSFAGIVRDISDLKTAQEALRDNQSLLQAVFDTEPECVELLDRDGCITMMNRAGLRMVGAESLDAVQGRCVYLFVAEEDRRAVEELTDRVFAGESGALEFGWTGISGAYRRLEMHAVPLRANDGTITALLGIARDVTSNRVAEERAVQAERLAAIGQMVAGLAHESRNAIQRAQACQEMLLLDLGDQPEFADLVHRTQQALDDLHRLYEEVRGYAAPIKIVPEVCNVSELWRKCWSNLEVTRNEKSSKLIERHEGHDLTCRIDRHRIEQVFRNILENSLDACPPPVEIVVECAEVRLHGAPALQIALSDNGPGLTSAQAESIFEPFFSTKQKGTGLGMAIAKRQVEAHGGRIEIGNTDRPGAQVIVTLPREPM